MPEEEKYHMRHEEKALPKAEQIEVCRSQKYLTMAMCANGMPYLVPITHGYSEAENCFYLHCGPEGKKIDFLRKNPHVWGVVVEDRGYLAGKCSHAFRTVMFDAHAEFVEDVEQKRHALALMMDQLEPDPAPQKKRLVPAELTRVTIVRLRVTRMTGKQSPPPKKV